MPVVVRVLVDDGRNEEGAEELAGYVLAIADADVLPETGHSGAVGGVSVGAHIDGGVAKDGYRIERVDNVACRQPGFLFGRQALDLRAIEEASVPVDEGREGRAGFLLQTGAQNRAARIGCHCSRDPGLHCGCGRSLASDRDLRRGP